MKPGTIVELPDGRVGTVVYHGLDGYGIKWGRHEIDERDFDGTNPLFGEAPEDWPWCPDATLRDPYPRAIREGMECVGAAYTVVD